MIGKCTIPDPLFDTMKKSPKVTHEVSLEARVDNIFRDYILESRLGRFQDVNQFDKFMMAVQAISKKLGGQRVSEILSDLEHCRRDFSERGELAENRVWIRKLLVWYYDPLYLKSRK